MHTNSPRETGVRRYRIIVGSYKIGKRAKEKRAKEKRAKEKRVKEKRAEVEAHQRESRRTRIASK